MGGLGSRHENGESSASKKLNIFHESIHDREIVDGILNRFKSDRQLRSTILIDLGFRSGTLAARDPLGIKDQVYRKCLELIVSESLHFASLLCYRNAAILASDSRTSTVTGPPALLAKLVVSQLLRNSYSVFVSRKW